jgi:hypothetical protein
MPKLFFPSIGAKGNTICVNERAVKIIYELKITNYEYEKYIQNIDNSFCFCRLQK